MFSMFFFFFGGGGWVFLVGVFGLVCFFLVLFLGCCF